MKEKIMIVDEYLFDKLMGKLDRLNEKVDAIIAAEKQSGLKETWYVTDEVCNLLNISRRSLQEKRRNGEIEFTKTGKKCYYKASSIDAFMEKYSV